MEHGWKHIVRQQFDASLDMLGRAIQACPATLWDDRERLPRFGELVYHALEVADRYLGRAGAEPALPEPFGRPADGSDQGAPERAFDREELIRLLAHVRAKGSSALALLDGERRRAVGRFAPGEPSALEALLYATRHTQHHVGQLYLVLGRHVGAAPGWVGKSDGERSDS